MQKLIFVDVDGTVALTHEEWFRRNNDEYGDDLHYDKVTDWGVHHFAKCGTAIYKYLEDEDLYETVRPYPGSIEGVRCLRNMGFRVVFLTSGLHKGKIAFLRRFGFIEERGDKDFIVANDKSLVDGENCLLIDDGYHNIETFKGIGILIHAPHNAKYEYPYRAGSWDEVIKWVERFETFQEIYGA